MARAALTLAGLAMTLAPLPDSEIEAILAAPAAQPERVWVVEAIDLHTTWAGDTGDGQRASIPDRQRFELSRTVTQGPRSIDGAIDLRVEHPAWIAPGEPLEMQAEARAVLDSRGSFGTATPAASLRVEVICGDTVMRGGRCGGSEQRASSFVSEPNAQNRSVTLSAGAAFPPGSWTAPPAPAGGITAWTVRFNSQLTLGTSFAGFGIAGTIRYRYSARPAAPPSFQITGRALGRPQPGELCPLNGAKVELLEAGSVIARTRALEPDGHFSFPAAPRSADLSLRVTLEHQARDPLRAGAFRVTYQQPAPAGPVPFVESRDFDGRVLEDPYIHNLIFDDLAPLAPDPPGAGLPPGSERAAVGVIYCHAWQAWKLSDLLGQTLDLGPPVDLVAYAPHGQVFWTGPKTFGVGAGLDPRIEIGRGGGASAIDDGGRPDNREWHEMGHQVLADALSDQLPNDPRDCPPGRPPGFDCNHLGRLNARTVDSWTEGFAEFYAMMVGREVMGEERPERYRLAGQDIDLERNYLSFDFVVPASNPDALISLEELAVAGLLLDLVDPPNLLDRTVYTDERGEARDYADCVQMDLDPHLWRLLTGDWDELHPKPPDAPDDYGHVFDIAQLYAVLSGEGWGQAHSRGGALNDLDALFVAHGFFTDADGDAVYDPGESIGGSGDPEHPAGLERRRIDWPERARLLASAHAVGTGRALSIARYRLRLRFEGPGSGQVVESWLPAGAGGALPLVGPPPHERATFEIQAYAEGGYQAAEPLLLDAAEYWRLMAEGPADHLLRHDFAMERVGMAYLPIALRPAPLPELAEPAPALARGRGPASGRPSAADAEAHVDASSAAARFGYAPERSNSEDPPLAVEACSPATATPSPTPPIAPTPARPVPLRVDPGHVQTGLDARLTVAGHFFAPGARVQVGEAILTELEDLGVDPEPPHYQRLRGNLAAGLPPGRHDLSVIDPTGESGLLPEGFAVLGRGTPSPTPELPLRVEPLQVTELGRAGPRSAFAPGQIPQVQVRIEHAGAEAAPAVLVLELRGPEGEGRLRWQERLDLALPPTDAIDVSRAGPVLSPSLPAGEYSLSATVKAFGKQIERQSQLYLSAAQLLADDFEDPGSGWQVGRSNGAETAYTDGEYRVSIVEPGILGYYWPRPWRAPGELVVEADARSLTGPLAELGLALELSETGDRALWLRVSNTGQLRLTRRVGDTQLPLTDWTFAPVLRTDQAANHLMLALAGGQLRAYAGGLRLQRLTLEDLQPGWAGVLAGSFDAPSEARFDHFRVYGLR